MQVYEQMWGEGGWDFLQKMQQWNKKKETGCEITHSGNLATYLHFGVFEITKKISHIAKSISVHYRRIFKIQIKNKKESTVPKILLQRTSIDFTFPLASFSGVLQSSHCMQDLLLQLPTWWFLMTQSGQSDPFLWRTESEKTHTHTHLYTLTHTNRLS